MNALIFATILMTCTPTEVLDWNTDPLVAISFSGSAAMPASAIQLRADGTTWTLSTSGWNPAPEHDWLSFPTGETVYEVYWNQEAGQILDMAPAENQWITLDGDMTWKFNSAEPRSRPEKRNPANDPDDRNAQIMITIRQRGREYGISKQVSILSLTDKKPPYSGPGPT